MKKISWFWMAISSIILIVVFVSFQQFGKLSPSADMLTEQEAEKLVQERYQGVVSSIKTDKQQYHIELEKQNQLYTIKLDSTNGKVLSFTQRNSESLTPAPSQNPQQNAELSEEKIKEIILSELVNGTIASIEKIDNGSDLFYKAIVVDKENQTTITVDAFSGRILSSNSIPIKQQPKTLTEKEAAEIARTEVQGEVEDIWFETENNQSHYLVKIETEDDREAIVQIHAITGNIMTVSWDDYESKQNDSNDNGHDDD
jgi:uncharacterized membrane protein YkoI